MKSILIIGIGRFGYHTIKELQPFDVEILAVDTSEERLKTVSDLVSKVILGDSAKKDFLETIGINNFDECIVAIGDDFQSSLETVLNLKDLGAKKVSARASKESQERLLLKIGADYVIYPEKQLAKWTALHAGTETIYDYMELDDGYGIYETVVPKKWIGKTLAELDLRKKEGISIIGLKKGTKVKVILGPQTILAEDERLIVMAKETDANKALCEE